MESTQAHGQAVLNYWFNECGPDRWFAKDASFDLALRTRFEGLHAQAVKGELAHWREQIGGRLAEIIVLDQFSRNMYRDTPKSFSQDAQALALAQEALRTPEHKLLPPPQRSFLYMPFMHSESRLIHETALKLFSEPGLEMSLKFEILHKDQIDRFGRYPQRNEILGRSSTPEEIEFLRTTTVRF